MGLGVDYCETATECISLSTLFSQMNYSFVVFFFFLSYDFHYYDNG